MIGSNSLTGLKPTQISPFLLDRLLLDRPRPGLQSQRACEQLARWLMARTRTTALHIH